MRWDTEQLVIDHSHAELVQRLIAKVRLSLSLSPALPVSLPPSLSLSHHELLPAVPLI